jgi:hypothetical protein
MIQVESSAATPLKLTRIAGNIKCDNNVCLEVRGHAQVMQHSNATCLANNAHSPHQRGRAHPLRSISGLAAETETVAAQLTLAKSATGPSLLSATSKVDILGATNKGFGWIVVSCRSHIQLQCGMKLTMYTSASVSSLRVAATHAYGVRDRCAVSHVSVSRAHQPVAVTARVIVNAERACYPVLGCRHERYLQEIRVPEISARPCD